MHQQHAVDPSRTSVTKIVQLAGTFDAFGMVADYLSRTKPFSKFDLGTFADAIRHQLREGHNLAAMTGPDMVGYAGWMLTTDAIARAWIEADGALIRVPADKATAAALTIVAVTDPQVTLRLIRGARELNAGKRAYFKRGSDGDPRGPRKSSVLIFPGRSTS